MTQFDTWKDPTTEEEFINLAAGYANRAHKSIQTSNGTVTASELHGIQTSIQLSQAYSQIVLAINALKGKNQ